MAQPASRTDGTQEPSEAGPAPGPDGGTRRGLLLGAGLAGAAGLVAACGGGSGGGGADEGGDGGDGGGAGGAIATTAEIPVGGGKIFKNEKIVVVQPSQGRFKAYTTECTHRGCDVGSVSGGTINCPCHGSKFAIADGSVTSPPAEEPLPEKQITVQGDQIMPA